MPELALVVEVAPGSTPAALDAWLAASGAVPEVAGVEVVRVEIGSRADALARVTAPYVAFVSTTDLLPAGGLERRLADVRTHGAAGVDLLLGGTQTFQSDDAIPAPSPPGEGVVAHDPVDPVDPFERAVLLRDPTLGDKTLRTAFARDLVRGLGDESDPHVADLGLATAALAATDRVVATSGAVWLRRVPRFTAAAANDPLQDPTDHQHRLRAAQRVVKALGALHLPEDAGVRASSSTRAVVGLLRAHVAVAPEVVGRNGDGALRTWFDGVHAVLASAVVDDVLQALGGDSGDGGYDTAVAFAAVLANDFELFKDRDSRSSRVVLEAARTVHGDEATVRDQLVLDVPLAERLRPLLELGRLRAQLERVEHDAEREVVVLRGRAWVPGTSPNRPLENEIRLRVAGNRLSVPVTPEWRPSRTSSAGEWRGFVAELPVKELSPGARGVLLSVTVGDRTQEVRAQASSGYLRRSRLMTAPGFGMLPGSDSRGRAVLTQYRGTRARARLRFRARLVRQDLAQLVRGRPFGATRVVRLLTSPFFRGRDIWLVGERRDTAQDNGLHLFRHLRGELARSDAHYLIAKDSRHVPLVAPFGNVVWHGSLRHKLYLLHAKVLVNSQDPDVFMLPATWDRFAYRRHLAWRIGSRRVFLGHGIGYNDVGAILQPSVTGFDLFVTAADREAEYTRQITGYTDEVHATGYPRYDALVPTPRSRTILFMPTWRRYLVSPSYATTDDVSEPYAGSAYDRFVRELLTSPALHSALAEHDFTLEFLAHYEIVDHVRHLEVPSTRVVVTHPQERDVQSAIRECDVMVTDWSSVFFDAAFVGTPVIHAPFDGADFRLHYREGWFDPDRDGFGPVARTPEQVVEHLRSYLAEEAVREPVYTARADAFFTHHDGANAARVAARIDELLA